MLHSFNVIRQTFDHLLPRAGYNLLLFKIMSHHPRIIT
jgi:hypothetical protein